MSTETNPPTGGDCRLGSQSSDPHPLHRTFYCPSCDEHEGNPIRPGKCSECGGTTAEYNWPTFRSVVREVNRALGEEARLREIATEQQRQLEDLRTRNSELQGLARKGQRDIINARMGIDAVVRLEVEGLRAQIQSLEHQLVSRNADHAEAIATLSAENMRLLAELNMANDTLKRLDASRQVGRSLDM
jgi:hypothetical protein